MSQDHKALNVCRAGPLRGRCRVPGDKSISHRGLIFAALARGTSVIDGFLEGRDCLATLAVMRELGLDIEKNDARVTVRSEGPESLMEPGGVLDCQNSGTTLRLLTGFLAPRPFLSILSGSPQLRGRPMARIVEPLRAMGARILGREDGRLAPLVIAPPEAPLKGLDYALPVASAQVKSALILSGLFADQTTRIREPGPARDHSERMLAAMGAPITQQGPSITIEPLDAPLSALNLTIPGDPSSAAFLAAAAALVPGSEVRIASVGVNPTRCGLFEALRAMGADIQEEERRVVSGEPIADLVVRGGEGLCGRTFGGALIVTMIDELPLLALVATQTRGPTVIRDAAELRVKESDRIAATAQELSRLGAAIAERPDGFEIAGASPLRGAEVEAHGDHRLAMTLAIAGLIAEGETRISGAATIPDSFPGFSELLKSLGAEISSCA